MRTIAIKEKEINNLGKLHEHHATDITFDFAAIAAEHPDATYKLYYQPPDEEAYEVGEFEVADGVGVWHITEDETAVAGYGKAEVLIKDENYCKKSQTYKTLVQESIIPRNGGEQDG